jgi:transcriptional regulator with XRE-family HTH domain
MDEQRPKPNNVLRQARKEKKLTQRQLAEALNAGLDTVRSWERGRRVAPHPEHLQKLTEFFQKTPAELGFDDGEKTALPELEKSRSVQLEEKNRRLLIGRMRHTWIDGVLRDSLYKAALIELELEEQPDALQNPWSLMVQETNRPSLPLPPGTTIIQAYDQANGQMLLLGEPGAGKTTLLLELARTLLARAEQDLQSPLPIVFNLASWSEKQTALSDWLIDELQNKYRVPRQIAQEWIEEDQLIILLDGLDETDEEARVSCVKAINAYLSASIRVVVASRQAEYFSQATRVELQLAVVIQPLTAKQIHTYITSAGQQLDGIAKALQEDTELREMVKTPLMLAVIALAYQGKSDIMLTGSIEERRGQIFNQYVQTMLARRRSVNYPPKKIVHWLSWLANQLKGHNQTVFYLERLQPDWLEVEAYRRYRLLTTRVQLGINAFISACLLACFRGDFIPNEFGLFYWTGGGKGNSVLGWMASGIGTGVQGATSLAFLFVIVISMTSLLAERKRFPFSRVVLLSAIRAGVRGTLRIGGVLAITCGIIFGLAGSFIHVDSPILRVLYGMFIGSFCGLCFGFQLLLGRLFKPSVGTQKQKKTTFSGKDRLINGTLFFLCGFLGFVVIYSWEARGIDLLALAYGLLAGITDGIIYSAGGDEIGFVHQAGVAVQPAESSAWSWQMVSRTFLENLWKAFVLAGILFVSVGGIVTFVSSVFYGIIYGLHYGVIYGGMLGGITGITGLLISVITSGWSSDLLDDRERLRPNEGIRRSMRNAIFAACLGGPVGGIMSGLISGVAFYLGGVAGWLSLGAGFAIIFTIAIGYEFWFFYGGVACIEHYLIRITLQHEDYMPRSVAFFEYGVERILLQRVGGGYIFIHRLLLEHFKAHANIKE